MASSASQPARACPQLSQRIERLLKQPELGWQLRRVFRTVGFVRRVRLGAGGRHEDIVVDVDQLIGLPGGDQPSGHVQVAVHGVDGHTVRSLDRGWQAEVCAVEQA